MFELTLILYFVVSSIPLSYRSERKNKSLVFENKIYMESMGDYVRIHTDDIKPIITKEKVNNIVGRLHGIFLRIHRSFIVNLDKIESFTLKEIILEEIAIPISWTYRQDALLGLSNIQQLKMNKTKKTTLGG